MEQFIETILGINDGDLYRLKIGMVYACVAGFFSLLFGMVGHQLYTWLGNGTTGRINAHPTASAIFRVGLVAIAAYIATQSL